MKNLDTLSHSIDAPYLKSKRNTTAKTQDPKENWIARQIKAKFQAASKGSLKFILPGGQVVIHTGKTEGPHAEIAFTKWRAIGLYLIGGELSFAEAYMKGDINVPSLTSLFNWYLVNECALSYNHKGSSAKRLFDKFTHLILNNNNRSGSKKNISYHYDLGNEFYAKWLDPSMTYSSADFTETNDLSEAQQAKYARIIKAANITDGQSVLEIGCGWGGMAEHLLKSHTIDYRGITISQEQLSFAKNRLKEIDTNKALCHFEDYRDTEGTYDSIVSVEMFEAVGERHWPTFYETIKKRLSKDGSAAVQVITIKQERFKKYRTSVDFIQKYIFPGGMLPSVEEFSRQANIAGLKVDSTYLFGKCYAETLRRWRQKFTQEWPSLKALGYDERFYRMWLYYLEYCEVGFETGVIDVAQFTLSHK